MKGHGTTLEKLAMRNAMEVAHLQALMARWRDDIAAARPQAQATTPVPSTRPAIVIERITEAAPAEHPTAVYGQFSMNVSQELAA